MTRVVLPAHLRELARLPHAELDLPGGTLEEVLDALEIAHPALLGRVRDPATGRRRPYVRWYACREDLSHAPLDAPLPEPVLRGDEPLLVVGAMSGG